jgi:hypothetical protein
MCALKREDELPEDVQRLTMPARKEAGAPRRCQRLRCPKADKLVLAFLRFIQILRDRCGGV